MLLTELIPNRTLKRHTIFLGLLYFVSVANFTIRLFQLLQDFSFESWYTYPLFLQILQVFSILFTLACSIYVGITYSYFIRKKILNNTIKTTYKNKVGDLVFQIGGQSFVLTLFLCSLTHLLGEYSILGQETFKIKGIGTSIVIYSLSAIMLFYLTRNIANMNSNILEDIKNETDNKS